MNKWVIKRIEDDRYVREIHPGEFDPRIGSYTKNLKEARFFESEAKAQEDACGNEYVASVNHEIYG